MRTAAVVAAAAEVAKSILISNGRVAHVPSALVAASLHCFVVVPIHLDARPDEQRSQHHFAFIVLQPVLVRSPTFRGIYVAVACVSGKVETPPPA